MARRFFYVSLGIFALSIAYHMGATKTTAQPSGRISVLGIGLGGTHYVVTDDGSLWYSAVQFDPANSNYPWTFGGNIFSGTTSVAPVKPQDESSAQLATLGSPRPNPFNPSTEIAFTLDTEGLVEVSIYSASGQLVRKLVDERQSAGLHAVQWDGRDDAGRSLASGTYVYQLRVNGRVVGSEKAVVLR